MSAEKLYLRAAVPPEKDGYRVSRLLKTEFRMTDGMIAALKWREGGILLEGMPVHTDAIAHAGQTLAARIDDGEQGNAAPPIPVPLPILYEDTYLAVLDKPAGMVVHGGEENGPPTLANALASLWGPEQAFHPVHRLDRGTSGLLTVAKNAYVSERLRRQLHTEDFVRDYLALVPGKMDPPRGAITLPIGPKEGERLRRCVRPDGQTARTDYETVEVFQNGSLLRLRLHTGRTHQIRVHLSALGHPLLGDVFYGGEAAGLSRPALHAAFLTLRHPITGERLELASPLPEDLAQIISHT